MNRAFSWKDQSVQILDKCVRRSEDDTCDKEENDTLSFDNEVGDNDEDELKTTDNSVFEMLSRSRQRVLQQSPNLDNRIRRWKELTDSIMSPEFHPRQTNCLSTSQQQVLAQDRHSACRPTLRIVKYNEEKDIIKTCRSDKSKVTFCFQYLIMTGRLKVTIVKATNMFQDSQSDEDLATAIEVCLMPGKQQRQLTHLCNATRNPVFNSLIYFEGLSLRETHQMCLRIKINGRDGKEGPLTRLGEISVALDNFDIVSGTKLEECINSRI